MVKHAAWLFSFLALLVIQPCSSTAQQPKSPPPTSAGEAAPSRPAATVPPAPELPPRPDPAPGKGAGCDLPAVLDEKGNIIFPRGATDIEEPVEVNEDRGSLSELYPGLDTTTDAFYPLPCDPSIGGTLPSAVNEPPTQDELDGDKYLEDFKKDGGSKILKDPKLGSIADLHLPPSDEFKMGDCLIRSPSARAPATGQKVPCDDKRFLASGQPFEGRDIIYVHGVTTQHFEDWISNVPGARTPWLGPQAPGAAEYLEDQGYFRKLAKAYWRDHIRENLFDPGNPNGDIGGWEWLPGQTEAIYRPKTNRYLIVAWSSNQTIEFAQHALLSQIQLAITSNKNVVTPRPDPTVVRPFCWNGCIIISHSTGPLVVDTAMSLAKAGLFGPGARRIPDYIHAQVSFAGAISGTRIATIGMAVAIGVGPAPAVLCNIAISLLKLHQCGGPDLSFVPHTILRDLMPFVSQGIWGPWVETTPVPTVMVAGGHPIGLNYGNIISARYFLPGFDDGVITMNSACGNPNPVTPFVLAPSGAIVSSLVKAFDFSSDSGKRQRAVHNFKSHLNLKGPFVTPPLPLRFLASGCTPYRTPTGMVMPIDSSGFGGPWDARNRYPNHYSFIQASLSHLYDGDGEGQNNPWPSQLLGSAGAATIPRRYLYFDTENVEETSAITNSAIYAAASDGTHLVKPSFALEMREVVTGKKRSFRIPFNLSGCPSRRCTVWLWKRTYHLLDPKKFKQSSHYVYEFVGRR